MAAWCRRHDREQRLALVPSQEGPPEVMTPAMVAAAERAVQVVTADGRQLSAGRATLFVLGQLGWTRFERIFAWPPLLVFVEVGYRLVANHRIFFSKFLFRGEKDEKSERS
jgi:predicted DCC family thiol-disulfide oxidoreductase YuxK